MPSASPKARPSIAPVAQSIKGSTKADLFIGIPSGEYLTEDRSRTGGPGRSPRTRAAGRNPASAPRSASPQPVLALNLLLRKAADPGQGAAAVGDGDRDHDLAGAGRIGDAHLHAVEVAAHEGGVLVAERNVERHAHPAALLGGGDQRRAAAERLTDRRAELGVQDGGRVLQLAVLADGGGLAVALDRRPLNPERRHGLLGQKPAQLLAEADEFAQILGVAAGERVLDHGDRRRAERRWGHGAAYLGAGFLDDSNDLSDPGRHGSSPPWPSALA